jgi:hypothetical protein
MLLNKFKKQLLKNSLNPNPNSNSVERPLKKWEMTLTATAASFQTGATGLHVALPAEED